MQDAEIKCIGTTIRLQGQSFNKARPVFIDHSAQDAVGIGEKRLAAETPHIRQAARQKLKVASLRVGHKETFLGGVGKLLEQHSGLAQLIRRSALTGHVSHHHQKRAGRAEHIEHDRILNMDHTVHTRQHGIG